MRGRGTMAGLVLDAGHLGEDRCVWRLDLDSSLPYGSRALREWAMRNGLDVPNVARTGVKIVERPDGRRFVEYDRLHGQPGARIPAGSGPDGRPLFSCERVRVPLVHPPAALVVADAVVRLVP